MLALIIQTILFIKGEPLGGEGLKSISPNKVLPFL